MMMIIIAFNFHSPLIEMHGGGGGIRSWGWWYRAASESERERSNDGDGASRLGSRSHLREEKVTIKFLKVGKATKEHLAEGKKLRL